MEPTEPTSISESRIHPIHANESVRYGFGTIQPEEGASFVTVDEYHMSDHVRSFPQHAAYGNARRVGSRLYDALMVEDARHVRSLGNEYNARGDMSGHREEQISNNTHTLRSAFGNRSYDAQGVMDRPNEEMFPDTTHEACVLSNEGHDAGCSVIGHGEELIPDKTHAVRSLSDEGHNAQRVLTERNRATTSDDAHMVRSLSDESRNAGSVLRGRSEELIPDKTHALRSLSDESHNAQCVLRARSKAMTPDNTHTVRSLGNEGRNARSVLTGRNDASTPGPMHSAHTFNNDYRNARSVSSSHNGLIADIAHSLRSQDSERPGAQGDWNYREGEALDSHRARILRSFDHLNYNVQCPRKERRQPEYSAMDHEYLPQRIGWPIVSVRPPDRTISKPVYEPGTFTGKEVFESYLSHFEIAADINAWNNREKAVFLTASLRGGAQEILMELSPSQRVNYEFLVAALTTRYASRGQAELNRLKLKNRRQGVEETLTELAHSVKCLIRKVYPGASEDTRRTLAKDSFVDALKDAEVRFEVMKAQCETIDDALVIAARISELKTTEAMRVNYRQVRTLNAKTEEEKKPTEHQLETLVKELQLTVTQLRKDVADMSKDRSKGYGSQSRTKSFAEKNKGATCWNCGSEGHFKADCPAMTEGNSKQQEN
ncbi:uncharacterized protein LOC121411815 [Lytechinus variegatus]|uniref:uncharacterized protein LOC121411815 n=1 Tax=Lytechinus variegatus TaxID=7654 RepID=UPI001BB10C26|nr:uncharacterized protein LOC121411815 [Lytechinus variegatus]